MSYAGMEIVEPWSALVVGLALVFDEWIREDHAVLVPQRCEVSEMNRSESVSCDV